MTDFDTEKNERAGSEARPIADRFWKTLSGTLKSVGTDERLKAALNAMVGEESLRSAIQSLLPRDTAQSLKGSMDQFLENLKVELLSFLRQRLDNLLQDVDIKEELRKFLSENQIEVRATISIRPLSANGDPDDGGLELSLRPSQAEPVPADRTEPSPAEATKKKKKRTSRPRRAGASGAKASTKTRGRASPGAKSKSKKGSSGTTRKDSAS